MWFLIYDNGTSMMGCCGEASGWAKVGLLLILAAAALQLTGYLTNNWMVYNTIKDTHDVRVGLWWMQNCSSSVVLCNKESVPEIYKTNDREYFIFSLHYSNFSYFIAPTPSKGLRDFWQDKFDVGMCVCSARLFDSHTFW